MVKIDYVKKVSNMDIHERKSKLSGSATVEATFVIPMYLYAVLTLVYILQFINVRCDMDEAAYKALKYQTGFAPLSGAVSAAAVYGNIINTLGHNYAKNHHIVGGNAGIIVTTDMADDSSIINVNITYCIRNPFDIFGVGILKENRKFTAEAWLGEEKSQAWKDGLQTGNEMVYITENSDVFHKTRQCSSLSVTIMEINAEAVGSARNENGGKYYECSSCKKFGFGSIIYITPYGHEYHSRKNCYALKRTILQVPIDSVRDKRPCRICGK